MMPVCSQRHRYEVHGIGVFLEPSQSITITLLSPDTAAVDTTFILTVTGIDLTGEETIVFDGLEYAADSLSPEQVVSAEELTAGTDAVTKQVYLQRGGDVSNELPFTVT